MSLSKEETVTKKEVAINYAVWETVKWFSVTLGAAAPLSYLAHLKIPTYRKRFGISAKVAIPLMAAMFVGAYVSETAVIHKKQELHQLEKEGKLALKEYSDIPFHHAMMNAVYDHTFKFVALLSLPVIAKIYNDQRQLQHLNLSKRIMHSRVLGQMSVLGILLPMVAFRQYMTTNGRYPRDPVPVATTKQWNR